MENLIPGVKGAGPNVWQYVKQALRPGVDKITFKEQHRDRWLNRFIPIIYQYQDSYLTNGMLHHQTLQRIVKEPDILFTAYFDGAHSIRQTGTSNWVNNGLPGADGPGVIQPPISINFNAVGPGLEHFGTVYPDPDNSALFFSRWGSFDGTTNPPVIYPVEQVKAHSTTFNLWLAHASTFNVLTVINPDSYYDKFSWLLTGKPKALFALQTSTNLSEWTTILTITNLGGNFTFIDDVYNTTPQRFFRTIPQ